MNRLATCLMSALLLFASAAASAQDVDAAREEFWQGNDAYMAGDYPSAVAHFQAAYDLAPNARIQEYLGRTFVALQRYPEAVEAFERAAEDDPEIADEIAETIAGLERDMAVASVAGARRGVAAALARARGEQPQPEVQLRTGLGTTMMDVPVQILSTPRGAEVYIDGLEFGAVGVTPLEIPLFTGPHLVEVRKPFYGPESQLLNVSVPRRGEPIPTLSFTLERLTVDAVVSATPPAARVTFVSEAGDRFDLGIGSFEGALPAGPGTFVLQHGGRDRRIDMVVESGEDGGPFRADLALEEQGGSPRIVIAIGTVRVVTEVMDARVFVDGREVGTGPGDFRADVTPGPHTVRIELDGHVPFEQEVDVTANNEAAVYVNALERARRRR